MTKDSLFRTNLFDQSPLRRIIFLSAFVLASMSSQLCFGQVLQRRTLLTSDVPSTDGKVKVAFFDADSTLRVSKSGSPSANGVEDFIILPGVVEKIVQLNKEGYLVGIVSNQGGIPKMISMESANGALSNMIKEFGAQGAIFHYYDFAENYDHDRKPETGMGERIEALLKARNLTLDKKKSFMVGDSAYKKADPRKGIQADLRPDGREGFNFSNSDRLFAENYGVPFFEPQYFFDWISQGVELIETRDDLKKFKTSTKRIQCRKIANSISGS